MGKEQSTRIGEQITRPAFRWYGGKWVLAPWIASHFVKHISYVEPCGGAGSVLIQKDRSPLETWNDLDGNLVNFFRVLRERPAELINLIKLTPWSRADYYLSYEPADSPVEIARRFYMRMMMGIGASSGQSTGMRMVKRASDGIPAKYHANCDHLYQIAERFMGVQVEQLPALECITRYDTPDTLVYFDPPYVLDKRTSGKEYTFEVDTQFHIEAAATLRKSQGFAVVSGYACQLYHDLYEIHGWQRVDTEAQTNGEKRTESIWLSPRTVETLEKERAPKPQMSLFEAV